MPRDFTIVVYRELLNALLSEGYSFQTYSDFLQNPKEKVVILRHDVDDRNFHSLEFAKIQHQLGINGTYYFRVVTNSYSPKMMRDIESMGHEVGLHYEEMDIANGDVEKAYQMFLSHLNMFRAHVNVSTICMHGSPKSVYDNKEIWNHYSYKDLGILGEPYFDLDVKDVFYLTDTGMMWDGHRYSIRDKMTSDYFGLTFHSTYQIIESVKAGTFPQKCMMNFHPQRWHNDALNWWIEKMKQNVKNVVKGLLLKHKSKK